MRLEIAYIAAFLDCDGTVCVVRAARGGNEGYRYYGKACFYSQCLSVLKDIQGEVGGTIPPLCSDVYQLQLSPRDTVAMLKLVTPYLRIKREQALAVLQLHEMIAGTHHARNRSGKGGMAKLPQSVYDARHAIYSRVCELNHEDSRVLRTNRVNSVKAPGGVTPSQAAAANDSAEGVTTREMSANNNSLHEDPARKGRHSLDSTVADPTIQ
jgi:hypothetical protein